MVSRRHRHGCKRPEASFQTSGGGRLTSVEPSDENMVSLVQMSGQYEASDAYRCDVSTVQKHQLSILETRRL